MNFQPNLPLRMVNLYKVYCWSPKRWFVGRFPSHNASNLSLFLLTVHPSEDLQYTLSYNIRSMVNLERICVLLFYYFIYFKSESWPRKKKSAWWNSIQFYFVVVNLNWTVLEKMRTDGESWPNDFDEKVNRGEDSRRIDSRCRCKSA